jgi:hypothetical protein
MGRAALEKINADLERRLKLAIDQHKHLAPRNAENHDMCDNIEEEMQKRLSNRNFTLLRLHRAVNKKPKCSGRLAERSSNAEIANTQMTQYLDKVTADLAASKAREASHSMEVAVAQTKFEEPCHTGQS